MVDFEDQFLCDSTNLFFGMLCGLQAELRKRGNDLLSTDFYETHILPHYQLTVSERVRVQAELMILNDASIILTYDSHYASILVFKSLNDPLVWSTLYKPTNLASAFMARVPYTVIERFNFMDLTGSSSMWATLWTDLSIFNLSPILDLIFTIIPRFTYLFQSFLNFFTIRLDCCKKIWSCCMCTRPPALFRLGFYTLRCYYFLNYFLSLHHRPLSDLRFVMKDSTGYINGPSAGSWRVVLFTFRLALMECLVAGFNDPKWEAYLSSVTNGLSEAEIRAEKAFKRAIELVTLTYAQFHRFLYLEYLFNNIVYVLVDGILYSSTLYNPASYSWGKIYRNLCTNVIL
jgi:hypothetical protein